MCAINPAHKKRFIIDVYTSSNRVSKKEFEEAAMEQLLKMEMNLNSNTNMRFHLKESKEEAE